MFVQEIPSQLNKHYIWTDLMPNKTYEVSVSMRNTQGEGPAAVTTVTTLPIQNEGKF